MIAQHILDELVVYVKFNFVVNFQSEFIAFSDCDATLTASDVGYEFVLDSPTVGKCIIIPFDVLEAAYQKGFDNGGNVIINKWYYELLRENTIQNSADAIVKAIDTIKSHLNDKYKVQELCEFMHFEDEDLKNSVIELLIKED